MDNKRLHDTSFAARNRDAVVDAAQFLKSNFDFDDAVCCVVVVVCLFLGC